MTAMLAVAARVIRNRSGGLTTSRTRPRAPPLMALAASSLQQVAGTTDGLNGAQAEWPIYLVPQQPHVDVDDVGVAFPASVPYVLEDLGPRQYLASVPHQHVKDRELPRRKANVRISPANCPRARVEHEVSNRQRRRPGDRCPTDQRAQPRSQLVELERFHYVVVGTAVQALHAIMDRVLRREHQDRHPPSAISKLSADLEPGDVRQPHVEND